jgi:hypothetical protein
VSPASLPPLLERFTHWFDQSPVPASLVALAVAVVAVALLRMALKFFLVFLLVLMIAILGSYLFMGEEETGDAIKDGVYEIADPPVSEEGSEQPGQVPGGAEEGAETAPEGGSGAATGGAEPSATSPGGKDS